MNYWRHSRELCEVRIAAETAQTDHAQANSSGLVRSTFAGRVRDDKIPAQRGLVYWGKVNNYLEIRKRF
jgi:hypothetical protein